MADCTIRPLTSADALAWRDVRLRMLRDEPHAFHADISEVEHRSDDEWRASMRPLPDAIFGLFEGGRLVGSAGFFREERVKLRHKGWLMAVYVVPELRGQGWGKKLVHAVIDHAREHVDVLLTGASVEGAPVYRAAGFETYGIERDASRAGGRSIDDELMAIHFPRDGSGKGR